MTDYGYVSGLLRSKEENILDYNDFVKLSELTDSDGLVRALSDTIYEDYFANANSDDYEAILEKVFLDELSSLNQMIEDKDILNLEKSFYLLGNIKLIYHALHNNEKVPFEKLSENSFIAPEDLYTIIDEKLYHKLPKSVQNALMECDNMVAKDPNPQLIEFILDKAFHEYQFDTIKTSQNTHLMDFFVKTTDIENLKNFLRAKRMNIGANYLSFILLEHGNIKKEIWMQHYNDSLDSIQDLVNNFSFYPFIKDGLKELINTTSFSLFEKNMDEYKLNLLDSFSVISNGIEVVKEYIELRKIEMKNLKFIFIGKINNLPIEEVKGRIRHANF